MKLEHVDLKESLVCQDARDVKTKFSKTFTTYFFPVEDDVRQIVAEWVRFLREEKLWGNDDPLFSGNTHRLRTNANTGLKQQGLDRTHWSTATPIRTIFREAFQRAGLPYFHPHSLRKTR